MMQHSEIIDRDYNLHTNLLQNKQYIFLSFFLFTFALSGVVCVNGQYKYLHKIMFSLFKENNSVFRYNEHCFTKNLVFKFFKSPGIHEAFLP